MTARRAIKWLGALVLAIAIASAALYAVINARCFQFGGDLTCRVATERKIVALSFDDGPSEVGVDAVLATLAPRRIKATFFLIGDRIEQRPDLARRLLAAGHELGNHSYGHHPMVGHDAAFYASEIARTDRLLRTVGVARPRWFRPPFGKKLIGLPQAARDAGYHTIMWDVADPVAQDMTPPAYADGILSAVRPGSIILIHPMNRGNETARRALPLIVDGLKRRGYAIVPVGTLLALERSARQ